MSTTLVAVVVATQPIVGKALGPALFQLVGILAVAAYYSRATREPRGKSPEDAAEERKAQAFERALLENTRRKQRKI